MRISIGVLIVQCCIVAIQATTKPVLLYSKVGQLVTSSTLVWQSFGGDQKLLENAVEAAKFHSELENYPIYVCRAVIEGVIVTGHTQKHDPRTVCVVSMHTDVRTHHQFDVLLNKGSGGKLTWKPWSKFSATIPTGAVSATSDGHVSIFKTFFFLSLFCFRFINSCNFSLDDANFMLHIS